MNRPFLLIVTVFLFGYSLLIIPSVEITPLYEDPLGYLYAGRLLSTGQGFTLTATYNQSVGPYFSLRTFQIRHPKKPGQFFLSYPPGFPVLLGSTQAFFRYLDSVKPTFFRYQPERAALLVAPTLGFVGIIVTILFGKLLSSWETGIWAALSLVLTPTFLRFATSPWSDIPGMTMLWIGIYVFGYLLWNQVRRLNPWLLAFLAGSALGYSFFIRYTNLIILAPLTFLLIKRRRSLAPGVILAMTAPVVIAVLGILIYNQYLSGHLFTTGYSPQHSWYPQPPFQLKHALGSSPFGSRSLLGALQALLVNYHLALALVLAGLFLIQAEARLLFGVLIIAFVGTFSLYFFPPVNINSRFLLPVFPAISLAIGSKLTKLWGSSTPLSKLIILMLISIWLGFIPFNLNILMIRNQSNQHMVSAIKTLTSKTPQDAVFVSYTYNDPIFFYGNRSVLNYRHIPTSDPKEKRWRLEELEPKLTEAVQKLLSRDITVYYIVDSDPPLWGSKRILESHFQLTRLQTNPPLFRIGPNPHP